VGYEVGGDVGWLCGRLGSVTQHPAINGNMKVENRRVRNRVREVMRRLGRSRVHRGVGEHRAIVIRLRRASVITRRVDCVRGLVGM